MPTLSVQVGGAYAGSDGGTWVCFQQIGDGDNRPSGIYDCHSGSELASFLEDGSPWNKQFGVRLVSLKSFNDSHANLYARNITRRLSRP